MDSRFRGNDRLSGFCVILLGACSVETQTQASLTPSPLVGEGRARGGAYPYAVTLSPVLSPIQGERDGVDVSEDFNGALGALKETLIY